MMAGVLGAAGLSALGADQPQWGEHFTRNMISQEKNLPDSFDPATGKNIKWIAKIGTETHATPTVSNGKVLIGTNNGNPRDASKKGDRGVLMCFNEADGAFIWQLLVTKRTGDVYLDWPGSGICSPATIEGDRAYVVSNRGEVICLDMKGMANGNDGPYVDEGRHMMPPENPPAKVGPTDADIIWLFDVVAEVGTYPHDAGHGSPLIYGDVLYVNTSNGVDNTHRKIRAPDAPLLIALDKRTGRLLARDDEKLGDRIVHCTWSSPALGEVNGKPQIFFGGPDGVVYAYAALEAATDPLQVRTFQRIWKFDCDPAGPKTDTHKYMGNRTQSCINIKSMPVFHDGKVFVTAGGDVWWGKRQSWLKCIDPSKTGDVTSSAEIWSYEMKSPCCSTPAIYDGLVYVADTARNVHCVDLQTGRLCWTHRLNGEIWASPLAADGKVYIGTRRGDFWIFAAGREKKVLSSIELDSPISSTATAANGVIYVTTHTRMYALKAGATSAPDKPAAP